MPAISSLIETRQSTHQTGIRQRSLRRHCRLGRATELVFVLATGVVLVLGGQASAQTWDAGANNNNNWNNDNNWDTAEPGAGGVVIINGAGGPSEQPTLTQNSAEVASTSISGTGSLTVEAILNSLVVNLSDSGSMTIDNGDQVRGTGGPANTPTTINMGSTATLVNNGTITGALVITNGTTTNNGAVTGATSVTGPGILTLGGSSNLSNAATLTVNGGTVNVNVADTVGGLILQSGIVQGSAALTSASTYDVQAGTVSAVLAGTVGLTKSTAGIVELAATNTYSGATTVNGGTLNVTGSISSLSIGVNAGGILQLDGAALAIASGITLTDTGNLTLTGANTAGFIIGGAASTISLGANALTTGDAGSTVFSGVMSGTGGSLVKQGAGTFTLDGANTYTGTTTISVGVLQVGNGATSGTLGTGNVINNAALELNRSDTVTIANAISGTGTVTQEGIGTTILTGANSYAGVTTVSAGTLQIGDGNSTGTLGTGNVTNNAALVFNRNNALAVGNIISGTGTVTQAGSGTTTLSGVNTYSGATTVNGGVLDVTGSITSLSLNVNAGGSLHLAAGALVNASGAILTDTGNITLNGANTLGFLLGGTNSTVSLGAHTLTTGDIGDTAFNGVMSGTGGALVKQGAGIFTLGGANDYTGSTTVNAGILDVTGSIDSAVVTVNTGGTLRVDGAAIADTAAVTLNGTGNLTLTGDETIGSLASAVNTSTVTLATNRLTTGDAADQTFAGIISGLGGGLTKQGTGTLTLSAINTYTGTTNVNAGTLEVTGSIAGNVIVDGTGRLRIADTEAIDGTITTTGSVVSYANGVNEASDLIISSATTQLEVENTDAATQSGVISSTGVFGFQKIGTGNLTVSGTNTYTGATVVSAGTLTISNDASLGTTGAGAGTSVTSGATLALTSGPGLTVAEAITLNGTGVANSGALRNVSGLNVISGAITLGSAARINADAGQLEINGGVTGTDTNLTVGGTGTTLFASNITTGAGSLTVDATTAAGVVGLTGTNDFTGGTTVNSGFLQLSNGSALADAGALTVNSAGTVQVINGETVGALSGSGLIALQTTGPLVAGDTTNTTFSGQIIESGVGNVGAFTKQGTGTLILSGTNTYTGLTAINGGALRIDGSVAGAVNVNNTGTLQGSGTVGGTVTVASGGTLAAGDGVGDAGVLTISGGLVLNAGSTTRFDLATPNQNAVATNDRIDVTGAVTLGGTLTVDGTLATGYYRLMNAGGGATGTFATSPVGATVLTNVANQVNLRVGPAAAVQFWDGANFTNNSAVDGGTSTWSATSTNWTTSNGQFNDSWQSGEAVFQGTAGTVTIDGAQSFQQLTFNTAGYVLNGPGTLVSPTASGFSILQTNADATINAAITGAGGINKTGTGVLTLGGLNTYAGATDIAGGTLRMGVSNALPSLPGTVVTITNGATLDVNGTEQIVGALTGATGTTVALGAGGRLVSTGAATTVFAGAVTGSNSSSFDYAGTGSLTLTGASTTTGSMLALAGRLELGVGATTTALRVGAINSGLFVTNGGALASNTNLITASGSSAVQLNGSETVGALTNGGFPSAAGVGTITLNGSGVILTVNGTGGASGVAGTVNGTGTLNVTGDTTTVTATGVVQTATTIGGAGTIINDGTMAGVTNAGIFTNNLSAGAVTNQSGGTFTNAATGTATSVTSAGTATNAGVITTTLGVTAGTTTNTGTVSGLTTVSGGVLNQDAGTLAGLTLSAGTVNALGGTVNGAKSVTGGVLNANGATFAGSPIVNNGGVVNVNANTTGSVTNTAGQLNVNAGATLTGAVSNAATTTIAATANVAGNVTNTGTLNHNGGITAGGNLVNSGTVNANGAVAGNVTNQSGGQFTLAPGAVASVGGTMTNQSGATTTIGAGANLSAAFINNAGATLSTSGTLSGSLTNNGTFTSPASATVTGAVVNNATMTATNALTFGSTLNNTANGTISAVSISVTGAMTNAGSLSTTGAANLGALTNSGTFNVGSLGVTGLTSNSSTITSAGNMNLAGGLTGGGTLNVVGGAGDTADVITVGGAGLTGPVTLQFDTNLALPMGSGTSASDRLVMGPGAVLTGNVALQFNVTGASGVEIDDILVIDVAEGVANNFSVVASGLPNSGGKFVYALDNLDIANGDVYLRNFLNPGISGLAGNVTLTQSLIGSVINRPSSPFVSGLAYDDEDSCGAGVWARAIGGAADASGSTSDGTDSFNSSLSATYAGVQLGGDYACFNGFFNGWDLAFGGIAGLNAGSVDQPVFAIDPSAPGNVSNVQTSTTTADFDQYYGGIYTAAVRGPLAIDLQYRVEKTDFDLTNTPIGGSSGLGLTGTEFSSQAQTLSGSVSYAFPIADSNITVLPVAGFAWTKTETDPIEFDNGDSLVVDDFENRTGFVGATVARSVFAEDGNSAFNQFVTATYYNDFADDPTSTFNFTDPDTLSRQVDNLVNENLGAYSELSVGLNYVRILNPGQAIPARQLNASIRADARFGQQLESWGVTGQLRLQF